MPDTGMSDAGNTGSVTAIPHKLSALGVAAAAYGGGFRGDDIIEAVKVAYSESDWIPTNHNSCCYGLWQIYLAVHKSEMAGLDWKNPIDNATAAHKIWTAAGSSWCNSGTPGHETCNPWQSYGNARYRSVDGKARMAATQLQQELASGKTPEQIVGAAGSGGSGIDVTPAGLGADLSSVSKLLSNLADPHWLKRVGIGILGALVVGVAVWFALPKQSGSLKAVRNVVNAG
jgi:hypothetical protein